MDTTVVVRPAEEADADSLGRVHAACWHETYDHLLSAAALSQLHPERLAAMWRRYASQGPEYRQVVAVVDGEIVGFAGTGPGRDDDAPRELELYAIYVLTAHHGSGAGQALLDAAIGAEPSFLWIATDNPRAEAFYRRNGFEFDGVTKVAPFFGEMLRESRMVR